MALEYQAYTSLDTNSSWYRSMCALHQSIFSSQSPESVASELVVRPKYLILVAMENDSVVGYKIGYQDRQTRFYSWLGGVYPEYRERGIGSELMRRQHAWCIEQGYDVVRTHTKNKWRSMLILNLRHGFDVIGTFTDEKGEPKIILEKRIMRVTTVQ